MVGKAQQRELRARVDVVSAVGMKGGSMLVLSSISPFHSVWNWIKSTEVLLPAFVMGLLRRINLV